MSENSRRDALIFFGLTGTIGSLAPIASAKILGDDSKTTKTIPGLLSQASVKTGRDPAISPSLRRIFMDPDTVVEPVGAGKYLVSQNAEYALAVIPVRYKGENLELPVLATFAEDAGGNLRLTSLEVSPINPFDMLQTPGHAAALARPDNLQQQYDDLAKNGGGVLNIPAGVIATNLTLHSRKVHICGAGRGATILTPGDPDRPVLQATYRDGSWNYVSIANLDLKGASGRGIGFAAGANTYVRGDEYAGRTRFTNVGFSNLDIAIQRLAGEIGLIIEQCGFDSAKYHLFSTSHPHGTGSAMHSGIVTVRDCHFTGAQSAVAYFDSSVAGTGGVLFDNCVMERNPGFVFYVNAFANVDATTDFVVRDCWNESNATLPRAHMPNGAEAVCYGSFRNTGMVRFIGTPLGSLTLRNAVVATYACPLDNLSSADLDRSSTLQHHDARGFGGYAPIGMTDSVAASAQSDPPGRALTFLLKPRSKLVALPRSAVLLTSQVTQPLTLTGTNTVRTQSVPDSILPGRRISQRLKLLPGMRVFPSPVAVSPRSWLVWLLIYRVLNGPGPTFQVSGDRGISAKRSLNSNNWQTIGGTAAVMPGAKKISLWLMQDEVASEILIGGYNLVSFESRQAALDFINSGHFAISG